MGLCFGPAGRSLIANSQAVQRRIERWWGRESTVIHPPVDISSFATPDISQLEKVLGHPEPGSYYLCLGDLVSYKRVDLAVKACTAPVGSSSYLVKGQSGSA